MKLLSKKIREFGLSMQEFCENNLKTDYRTFQHRMRTERYYPAEVIYICMLLKDRCENIFGKSFDELVLMKGTPSVQADLRAMIQADPDLYAEIIKTYISSGHIEPEATMLSGNEPLFVGPGPDGPVEPVKPAPAPKVKPIKKVVEKDPPPPVPKPPKPSGEEEEFEFKFIDIDLTSPTDASRKNH